MNLARGRPASVTPTPGASAPGTTNRYRPIRYPTPPPRRVSWDDCLCGARHIEAGWRRPAPSLVPDVVYASGGHRRLDFALLSERRGPKRVGWAKPEFVDLLGWKRGRDWVKRGVVSDYERGGDNLWPEAHEAREWLPPHKTELAQPKDASAERLPKLT